MHAPRESRGSLVTRIGSGQGLALATVGWVISSWIRLQLLRDHPSDLLTGACAAAGFALGVGAVLAYFARQEARRGTA